MKMRSLFLISLVLVSLSSPALSQTPETGEEGRFTTRGVITQIDLSTKTLLVRNEGGLELTFHLNDGTQVRTGKTTLSAADLKAEDEVEIDYEYNADFEKIVRTVTKSSPISSGKK